MSLKPVFALVLLDIFGILAGVYISLALLGGIGTTKSTEARPAQTIHGLFEGIGTFTLGCSLWSEPSYTPYSDENKFEGYAVIQFSTLPAPHNGEVLAIIDGPQGTALLSGTRCGLSTDWRAIPPPTEERGN